MRVLYIHQYFKTPKDPGGTRSYWLSRALIDNGYQVTMVTTNSKQEKKVIQYEVDGIQVVSYRVFYSQSMGIIDRLKSFSDFMIQSFRYALKHSSEYDFIFATSTPLTVGVAALGAKWIKMKKYIFEVRDLWPEVPIQMGAIKNPFLMYLARWLEKSIYEHAEHVIALSPGMQEGVVKFIPKDKTSMIPNMSKINEFWPRERDYSLMRQVGLREDYLKVIHFGSLGEANGINSVIESAALLKNEKIQFLFLGGTLKRSQAKIIEDLRLDNILLHARVPMQLTSEIVNLCDVSLVSFKDLPILYTNSPNKLFDSLSAGKLIIVNSAGWTKKLVEESECGFYCDPKRPEDLADTLKMIVNNMDLLTEMGRRARDLAENTFDKSILCRQFVQVINSVVQHRHSDLDANNTKRTS